jgi:hypothetical protein
VGVLKGKRNKETLQQHSTRFNKIENWRGKVRGFGNKRPTQQNGLAKDHIINLDRCVHSESRPWHGLWTQRWNNF